MTIWLASDIISPTKNSIESIETTLSFKDDSTYHF